MGQTISTVGLNNNHIDTSKQLGNFINQWAIKRAINENSNIYVDLKEEANNTNNKTIKIPLAAAVDGVLTYRYIDICPLDTCESTPIKGTRNTGPSAAYNTFMYGPPITTSPPPANSATNTTTPPPPPPANPNPVITTPPPTDTSQSDTTMYIIIGGVVCCCCCIMIIILFAAMKSSDPPPIAN